MFYIVCVQSFLFSQRARAVPRQAGNGLITQPKDTGLINSHHLDYLYTPVHFSTGTTAAGIFIYAEAPDYHLVAASGEGFTCVDDVARAALFYLRSKNFATDTTIQSKVFNLVNFLLEMQAGNGYFYNFLLADDQINTGGATSTATPIGGHGEHYKLSQKLLHS